MDGEGNLFPPLCIIKAFDNQQILFLPPQLHSMPSTSGHIFFPPQTIVIVVSTLYIVKPFNDQRSTKQSFYAF